MSLSSFPYRILRRKPITERHIVHWAEFHERLQEQRISLYFGIVLGAAIGIPAGAFLALLLHWI